jgi:hypothetical protein
MLWKKPKHAKYTSGGIRSYESWCVGNFHSHAVCIPVGGPLCLVNMPQDQILRHLLQKLTKSQAFIAKVNKFSGIYCKS